MISILYVRGCIIEANKEDTDQDVLTKRDIKKININLSNDIYFDIQHNLEPITGCRLIENTITDYPVSIAGQMINEGSWLGVVEVDNSEIEQLLLNGKIKGFSLFSYANGFSAYKDVIDTADVHPLFISFVEYPANQVLFEVLDRDMYISKMGAVNLAEEEKSFIDKIKDLIKTEEESASIEKADEEVVEEKATEIEKAQCEEISKADEEATEEKEEATDIEKTAEPISEEPTTPNNEDVSSLGEEPTNTDDIVEKPKEEDVNAVAKEDVVAGEKLETQEGIEKDESGVTNAEVLQAIKDLTDAILLVVTPNEEVVDDVVEEITTEEEPETYIIKQATQKADNIVKGEGTQKRKYFDMLGRKIE